MSTSAPSADAFDGDTTTTFRPPLADLGGSSGIPYLVMTSGRRPGGAAYAGSGRPVTLGSDPAADIGIPDESVAPAHARISRDGHEYVVDDLGAPTGTFVQGNRITHAALHHGDLLRLGAVELMFLLRGQKPEPPVLAREIEMEAELPPLVPEPLALPAPETEDGGLSAEKLARALVRLGRFVGRHARLLFLCTAAGICVGLGSFSTHPPQDRAGCEVAIHVERASPLEPDRQARQTDVVQFVTSAEQAFGSHELVRGTLRALALPADDDSTGRAVAALALESQGTLWRARYQAASHDPVAFLELHLQRWVSGEVGRKLKVMTAEVAFLRGQMANLDREMTAFSARAVAFREQNLDRLPDQNPMTVETRAQLEARRLELGGAVVRLEGALEGVQRQLARAAPIMQAKVQSSERHREALSQVEHRLSELRAQGLADGHPEVRRAAEQERGLRQLMNEELSRQTTPVDRIANPAYEQLRMLAEQHEASLRAARTELRSLQGGLGRLQRISRDVPRVTAQLEDLSKTEVGLQRLHAQLFDRLRKAELELELERVAAASRFETVIAPRLEPLAIKRVLAGRLALGIGLGLLAALAVLGVRRLRGLVRRIAREDTLQSA